ncbi:hypothetical protein [Faecalibaculum rodentium]|uniref:hypothetical protein n=1 Tax=Faecalibaculum rodentium TaxID=1702221 RepID=UPI002608D22A|nr:hypothetical protein [Faecalibaculum rodentium]
MSNSDFAVTMYESDPTVAALNRVPGFDPLKLMGRKRTAGAEKDEESLDFRYKKLWFRLAHRTGRIRLNRLSITEQLAIIEAQVYLELTDANPVSSFTAACTREEGGDKYIESAQIRAMDQALTDAGFGLQFVPAPVGSTENTVPQAVGAVANVQMPKVPQPVMQQGQQAAGRQQVVQQAGVPQRAVAVQAAPQQATAPQPAVAQQKTAAAQAVPGQRIAVQQAGIPQKTVATQAAPRQGIASQQAGVPQRTVAAQAAPQQRAVPQQAAPQQRTAAQQSAVQQQTAVSQQRSVAQQAAVQPQAVRQSTAPQAAVPNKPARTAQVQAQTVQAGQKGAAIPAQAGMQTAAVNPAAPAAPQKAAVPVSTQQAAAQQPVSAETLPAGQLPVAAEAQELPVTSDIAAAMSLLSGKKEDTLPVAPAGMKAGEKAESMPQELPVAPAASVSEMPAAPAPAANAGGAADEGRPYTEETPVEEILQFMTLEDAKKVVVSAGTCRGQTIAEVAQRRPFSLKFYLSEAYQGRDNILRAAARLMLDNMEKKAG